MKRLFLPLLVLAALASAQIDPAYIAKSGWGVISGSGTGCSGYNAPQNCVFIVTPPDTSSASVQISGAFVATLQFEVSVGGNTWTSITASGGATSATAPGVFSLSLAGARFLRVRASAYTSGTARVDISTSTAQNATWFDDGNSLSTPAGRNVLIGTTVLCSTIGTNAGTSYTVSAANNGCITRFTAGTDVTLTIPSGLGAGFSLLIVQRGAGAVIPTAGNGVTIRQRQSFTKTAGQYAIATLACDAADDCILSGDLQ